MRKHQKQHGMAGMKRRLPTAQNEDVEFSAEAADSDDLEAQQRAESADARQRQ
jgi:hypothetical protein